MLKLFTPARPVDHLLTDPKRLADLLSSLPEDANQAIEQVTKLLEEVSTDSSLTAIQAAEAVQAIDDAAQLPAVQLRRELFAAGTNRNQVRVLWATLGAYTFERAEALTFPIEAAMSRRAVGEALLRQLPRLIVRALRAWSELSTSLNMRYMTLDDAEWERTTAVYASAEKLGCATNPLRAHPNSALDTTAQEEFVRLCVFAASSPNALDPAAMPLLDHFSGVFASRFEFTLKSQPGSYYWVDLERGRVPARVTPAAAPRQGLRFLSGVTASQRIEEIVNEIVTSGGVPAELRLDQATDLTELTRVLQHLIGHWGLNPRTRKTPRHKMQVWVSVRWGLESMLDALGIAGTSPTRPEGIAGEHDAPESWLTEEVGAGGFSAVAPSAEDDDLNTVDSLVIAKSDGSPAWNVGIVRRMQRRNDEKTLIGVQIVARAPIAVTLNIMDAGQLSSARELAVLLADPRQAVELQIFVPSGVNAANRVYYFEHRDDSFELYPMRLLAQGPDYDLILCRVQSRASFALPHGEPTVDALSQGPITRIETEPPLEIPEAGSGQDPA